MPTTRAGRLAAGGYVLAVLISTVSWLVQGAYSAWFWSTVLLTLPFGYVAEGFIAILTLAMVGLPETLARAFAGTLVLITFPGLAFANVVMGRAAFLAVRGRCRGCRLLHRGA